MNGVLLTGKWTHESTVPSPRVFLNTSLGSPQFWNTRDQLVFIVFFHLIIMNIDMFLFKSTERLLAVITLLPSFMFHYT